MKQSTDHFRPTIEPARTIYDSFQEEAAKRGGRELDDWVEAERLAVLRAANQMADRLGVRRLTLEQISVAERNGLGHVDYGAKWAYAVQALLLAAGEQGADAELESSR